MARAPRALRDDLGGGRGYLEGIHAWVAQIQLVRH
jgi:hypothetical protein